MGIHCSTTTERRERRVISFLFHTHSFDSTSNTFSRVSGWITTKKKKFHLFAPPFMYRTISTHFHFHFYKYIVKFHLFPYFLKPFLRRAHLAVPFWLTADMQTEHFLLYVGYYQTSITIQWDLNGCAKHKEHKALSLSLP